MSEIHNVSRRPLTTLERYLLRSEKIGGAMVFVSETDFDGIIKADTFAKAIRITLAHHPLLGSVVEGSCKSLVWRPGPIENVFRQRRATQLPRAYADPIGAIDLRNSPGVRIELTSTDDERSRIVAYYHHVCADGQGVARFFRDVCAVYATLLRGEPPKLNLECERLDHRDNFQPHAGQSPIGIAEGLRNLWVTVRGRTARFPCLEAAQVHGPTDSLVMEAELDAALTAQIRGYLLQRQAVLNDFSLAAAFLMLAQTDLNFGGRASFSILNPVDLRGWADRRLPAANRVGFAFIRRQVKDCLTVGALAESVDQQMRYVRKRGVAAELIKGVEWVERIPGCLALIEKSCRFTSTASLTCMSNLSFGRRHGLSRLDDGWQLGGASVRRVSAAGPLPPGVPLAITIIDSGGKLLITMRGCCQYFTAPFLDRLLDSWQSGCEMICRSPQH